MCLFCCLATVWFISSGFLWWLANSFHVWWRWNKRLWRQRCARAIIRNTNTAFRISVAEVAHPVKWRHSHLGCFCKVLKDSSFCLSETFADYLEAQCYADHFQFTAQLMAEKKLICRNIPVHCDSKGHHFDLSVSVCACLSPRPDYGSKIIAEVLTQRGFWMFRFKFCRAGVETLVRNGSFKQLADWKDKASLQTVFAFIISPSTEKQSSASLEQKK